MFVFAIETDGKTVAFTKETDRTMLDGVLNGQREHLRDATCAIRTARYGTAPHRSRPVWPPSPKNSTTTSPLPSTDRRTKMLTPTNPF